MPKINMVNIKYTLYIPHIIKKYTLKTGKSKNKIDKSHIQKHTDKMGTSHQEAP